MKSKTLISLFATVGLLVSSAAMAQQTKPAGESTDLPPRGGTIAIPDAAYDGTLASMACQTVAIAQGGPVEDVAVDVQIEHTFVGDLTFKVLSPAGTVATVMSRPGLAEPADDGSDCCGTGDDILLTDPVDFAAGNPTDAEDFAAGGGSYFPNPDSAVDSGDLSTIFDNEETSGTWQFCAGDGAGGDTGNLGIPTFTITSGMAIPEAMTVPTMGRFGLIGLALALALVAGIVLVRRTG